MASILVVDDDRNVRELMLDILVDAGHAATGVEDGDKALLRLASQSVDLVLLDLDLPRRPGQELLPEIRARRPPPAVIVVTADRRVESVIETMRCGAEDYVVKPVDEPSLLFRVERVLEARGLRLSLERLRRPDAVAGDRHGLVGESPALRAVLSRLGLVAPSDVTVLVTGESGTGKELVARALHAESGRRGGPFVAASSAAIPGTLLEAALFGHVRGAFTGALRDARGLFEEARGGTLFLDEIGEAPLEVQAKLLRAVESRVVRPVGADRDVVCDVRLVAATNRELRREIAAGRFRPDLFYRLAVFPLELPPLRERPGDVPLLASHHAERFSAELGRPFAGFRPAALDALCAASWPGNVRQLENVVKQAVLLAAGGAVGPEHLPSLAEDGEGLPGAPAPSGRWDEAVAPFAQARGAFELQYVRQLLEACRGNVTKAAALSGMDRKELYARIKKFGLELERFRE